MECGRELSRERLDSEIPREHGINRRIIAELDRHLPEAAHLTIAAALQQRACCEIGGEGDLVDSRRAERPKPVLAAVDQLRPEATPAPPAMNDADCEAGVVMLLDPAKRDRAASLLE